ncbi:DUF6708 domain-containing protein [Budvicia diplopodorum]|uniref:DUF6708 domain-containing protein n=1 Tax=Budvicia diplopodorum TaxID=1119056 RepID=UPI001359F31D|nr:DUF6708 domain-containing protein [Budvicia diplopodorum]
MIYYDSKVRKMLRTSEITGRYSQNEKAKLETTFLDVGHATVRLSSTYLETADREYDERGTDTFTALICFSVVLSIFSFFVWGVASVGYNKFLSKIDYDLRIISVCAISFLLAFSFSIILIFKDVFRYTHYPIRFNRKNRMVYIFLRKGKVISAPWDEIIFCSDKFMYMMGANQWGISGHILSKDKKQVELTFQLGYSSFLKPMVDSYWEFIRRYMEDGPEAVQDAIPFYIPVEKRKETFIEGFVHLFAPGNPRGIFSLSGVFMALIHSTSALGRFVAMKTSKIPVWPPEVEEQCQIEPNDSINLGIENSSVWTWRKGWFPANRGINE